MISPPCNFTYTKLSPHFLQGLSADIFNLLTDGKKLPNKLKIVVTSTYNKPVILWCGMKPISQ